MNSTGISAYAYKVGGSLAYNHPTYIERQADLDLQAALQAGKFCYVFNCRQMGKSSLRVRAMHQLQEEGSGCASVDITSLGSDLQVGQWYGGIITQLFLGFNLAGKFNLKAWLRDRENLPPVQKLAHFLEEGLLAHCPQKKLYIFIDEIDKVLSLPFSMDDFFSLIRFCYNQRADNPQYDRLVFSLFGVAAPSDLIQEKSQTPFNIGQAIELTGFTATEAAPLARGLKAIADRPNCLLEEIISWTGGQPFLTQKLCAMLAQIEEPIAGGKEAARVARVVQSRLIEHWETQDEPVHLKTIRDRLFRNPQSTGQLLGLYQQILRQGNLELDNSPEQAELRLSGLVVRRNGGIVPYNPIYQAVFNANWVQRELEKIRPYSQAIADWIASEGEDESRLLRGQALKDALAWAIDKNLSPIDYQFLTASQNLDKREADLSLATERQANEILKQANRQARRSIRLGIAILACSVLGAAVAVRQSQIASYKQQEAQRGTELERAGDAAERQFEFEQIDALMSAMEAGQSLQALVGDRRHLATYPATSPILALEKILGQILEKNRLLGHQDTVTSLSFSPNGQWLATASRDKTIYLWSRQGQKVQRLQGHQGDIYGVAFSPDGQTLASVSQDRTLRLWSISGKSLQTFRGHAESVYSVAFSPDGQFLATTSRDNTARLWNLQGKTIAILRGHQKSVDEVTFSPDGGRLVTASRDGTVRMWTRQGKELWRYRDRTPAFFSVSFSPDGRQIAVAGSDGSVKLLNPRGQLIRSLNGHRESVNSVAFSRDGQWLVTGSNDGTAQVWNAKGEPIALLMGHADPIFDVAIDSQDRRIATADLDGTVKIWDLRSKAADGFRTLSSRITAAEIAPEDREVAIGSEAGVVTIWNERGKLQHSFQAHGSRIRQIDFSPSGETFATISAGGTIKLWSRQGNLLATLPDTLEGAYAGSFSSNGQILAIATKTGQLSLWDVKDKSPHPIRQFQARAGRIVAVQISPDGLHLAEIGEGRTIQIWTTDGKLLTTLPGHGGSDAIALQFSPDGRRLVTAARDGSVRIWSIEGTLLHTLRGDGFPVYRLSLSTDGQRIATGSSDGTARVWDGEGNLHIEYKGDGDALYALAFSPNGRQLIAVARDGQVRFLTVEEESERLQRLLAKGCQWLDDYLQTYPPARERLPICTSFKPKSERDGSGRDGRGESGRSHQLPRPD